jgi:hypothetical protein
MRIPALFPPGVVGGGVRPSVRSGRGAREVGGAGKGGYGVELGGGGPL